MSTRPDGAVVYHGYGNTDRAGARLVTVERDGQLLGELRHVMRHSPTGMSWGYGGSGPADLARSLLVDALGGTAHCATCAGRGQLACRITGDTEDPAPVTTPYDPQLHSSPHGGEWEVVTCWDCDGDGLIPIPYQAFKREIVAGLPDDQWVLTRAEILDWLARHGVTR